MKTYSTQLRVEGLHIDRGNHMNWRKQLEAAEDIHFEFRERFGLGLEELRDRHNLFLVFGTQKATYRKQLRLGDILEVSMTIWVARPTALQFDVQFVRNGEVVTEMTWLASFVSIDTEKLRVIPQWVLDAVGV